MQSRVIGISLYIYGGVVRTMIGSSMMVKFVAQKHIVVVVREISKTRPKYNRKEVQSKFMYSLINTHTH